MHIKNFCINLDLKFTRVWCYSTQLKLTLTNGTGGIILSFSRSLNTSSNRFWRINETMPASFTVFIHKFNGAGRHKVPSKKPKTRSMSSSSFHGRRYSPASCRHASLTLCLFAQSVKRNLRLITPFGPKPLGTNGNSFSVYLSPSWGPLYLIPYQSAILGHVLSQANALLSLVLYFSVGWPSNTAHSSI